MGTKSTNPQIHKSKIIVDKKFKKLLSSCWVDKRGYVIVYSSKQSYRLHRLIFLKTNGYLPKEIDHKNKNKLDNTIKNLRSCTRSNNCMNRNFGPNKGVRKMRLKWQARISINKKQIHLGTFNTKEEAKDAYTKASKKYHGEFRST